MSQHWYDMKGNPAYTIKGVNGKTRDTTLRDARKLGLVPSVTTIINQLSKPGLDVWKQNKLIEAAYNQPVDASEFLDFIHYKEEVLKVYKEEMEKAPTLGLSVHDELEQWYKSGGNIPPGDRIAAAVFAVREQIGKDDYKAEQSFSHRYGFGGKIDLIGEDVIIDFKTKNTDDPKKMIKTHDYTMQLAAYRYGLDRPTARCFNVYISTTLTPSGRIGNIIKIVEYTDKEVRQAWRTFKCLLKFWQLSNGIEPEVHYAI